MAADTQHSHRQMDAVVIQASGPPAKSLAYRAGVRERTTFPQGRQSHADPGPGHARQRLDSTATRGSLLSSRSTRSAQRSSASRSIPSRP
jgi:hypothetical protein